MKVDIGVHAEGYDQFRDCIGGLASLDEHSAAAVHGLLLDLDALVVSAKLDQRYADRLVEFEFDRLWFARFGRQPPATIVQVIFFYLDALSLQLPHVLEALGQHVNGLLVAAKALVSLAEELQRLRREILSFVSSLLDFFEPVLVQIDDLLPILLFDIASCQKGNRTRLGKLREKSGTRNPVSALQPTPA